MHDRCAAGSEIPVALPATRVRRRKQVARGPDPAMPPRWERATLGAPRDAAVTAKQGQTDVRDTPLSSYVAPIDAGLHRARLRHRGSTEYGKPPSPDPLA